jgi:hypothetical protein
MRKLTSHLCEGKAAVNTVEAVDEPGSGGASHCYQISGFHCGAKGIVNEGESPYYDAALVVNFQNGPINEVANGIQNEDLLTILIDRMQGFQSGKFACRENAIALTHLQDAMHWLLHRTRERVARGVEGTHTK